MNPTGKRTRQRTGKCLAGILALTAVLGLATKSPAQNIARALYDRAPDILQILREQKYQNVGVLKFAVTKGTARAEADRLDAQNLILAKRLALALILSNDPDHPIGIVADASAVAAGLPGADHRTDSAARRKLFEARYPLPWGGEKVTPDAFLTGELEMRTDLTKFVIRLFVVNRLGNYEPLPKMKPLEVNTDASGLVEANESYVLRGAKPVGEPTIEKVPEREPKVESAREAAREVREGKQNYSQVTKEAPVQLKIFYAGKEKPVNYQGGRFLVAEPQEGQKVVLRLVRQDRSRARYAVVLKVNGLNTLNKQRFPDPLQCDKWVLNPGFDSFDIEGFQVNNQTAEEFGVLSRLASRQRENYYGAEVGTISFVVFAESRTKRESKPPRDEDRDIAAIERAEYPSQPARNLDALQYQLRQVRPTTRGLIVEGGKPIASTIRWESFDEDPTPVTSVVISYYRPGER